MNSDVPVSRSELIEISRQIENMRFGCSLLERKKEALLREIETDRATFRTMRQEVEGMLSFVSYAYALVQLFEGESVMTLLSWGIEPRKVRIVRHALMGCRYSQFFPEDEERGSLLGGMLMDPALASLHVDELLENLARIEPVLWRYINLKSKLDALELEFEKTRRKVNNLEQEMLPGLEEQQRRIRLALAERERDEAFSVKKMLGKRARTSRSRSLGVQGRRGSN
jgi:V/A-type H+-transporting ATPase subunit D